MDIDPNHPTAAEHIQHLGRLYLFGDKLLITYGLLQCTGQTRKREQCRLTADYENSMHSAHEGLVPVPLDNEGWVYARKVRSHYTQRLLAQRCEHHDTPDSADAALPDWQTYEPDRHPGHLLGFPRQAGASVLSAQARSTQLTDAECAASWAIPAALPVDPALFASAMRDMRLTWRARGILAELAAGYLPGHEPKLTEFTALTRTERGNAEGREAFQKAVGELRRLGYLVPDGTSPSGVGERLTVDLSPAQAAHHTRPHVTEASGIPAALVPYGDRVAPDLAAITEMSRTKAPEDFGGR